MFQQRLQTQQAITQSQNKLLHQLLPVVCAGLLSTGCVAKTLTAGEARAAQIAGPRLTTRGSSHLASIFAIQARKAPETKTACADHNLIRHALLDHPLKSCRSTDAHMPMSEKQLHRPLCQGACGLTRAILSSLSYEAAVDTDNRSPVCSAINYVRGTCVGCVRARLREVNAAITWKCKRLLVLSTLLCC